jgi:hypothetical protein
MNKREFILAACAACTAVLPAVPAMAALSIQSVRPSPGLTHGGDAAAWRHWVGQRFELDCGDTSHMVTLSEVRESASSARHVQFTVVFDGADASLSDGIHTLRHASGQQLELFVEAVSTAPGRAIAHFSLLT